MRPFELQDEKFVPDPALLICRMPDFDATLKILLRRLTAPVFERLTGVPVIEWLQPELPEIRTLRPDPSPARRMEY